jgi:hypothetical protein
MYGQGPTTALRFSFVAGKVGEIAKTRRPCSAGKRMAFARGPMRFLCIEAGFGVAVA